MQCSHGAACVLQLVNGGLLPNCSCDGLGNGAYLPVTMGCKRASNGEVYVNKVAARMAMCTLRTYLTFEDLCAGECCCLFFYSVIIKGTYDYFAFVTRHPLTSRYSSSGVIES